MPEKFDELSDEQLEQVSLPVDEQDVNHRSNAKVKPKKTALWIKILLAFLLLVCLALFAWVYFLQQSLGVNQNSLLIAQSKIEHLQQRLSMTDENMSDSSVTLRLHIKELNEKTEQLWQQMDKLWASAWRRNQKEIGNMTRSIESLLREQKSLQKGAKQQRRKLSATQTEIETLQQQAKKMRALQTKQRDQLQLLQEQIGSAEKGLKQLNADLKKPKANIERLQIGLVQLQQQMEQLSYSIRQLQRQAPEATSVPALEPVSPPQP